MRLETFRRRSRIAAPVERVFAWHQEPRALGLLIPPGAPVRLLSRTGSIRTGDVTVLAIGRAPFCIQWVAVHRDYIPNRRFRDVQVKGPFAYWVHTHSFEPDGPAACFLEDCVEYALPLGALTQPLAGALVQRRLQRMFDYRHAVTARQLARTS